MQNGFRISFELDTVSHSGNAFGLSETVPTAVEGTLFYPYILVYSEKGEHALSFRKSVYRLSEGNAMLFPTAVLKKAPRSPEIYYVYLSSDHMNIGAPKSFSFDVPREATRLFRRMDASFGEGTPVGYLRAVSDLYRILSLIAERTDNYGFMDPLSRGVQYMRAHFTDPFFSVSDIFVGAGVAEESFRTEMREVYGISPKDYLARLRVEYATKLLRYGVAPSDTARRAGFPDTERMNEVFRRVTGERAPKGESSSLLKGGVPDERAVYEMLRELSEIEKYN